MYLPAKIIEVEKEIVSTKHPAPCLKLRNKGKYYPCHLQERKIELLDMIIKENNWKSP